MGKTVYVVNGKGDISPEAIEILKAIVQKARKERNTDRILEIIKNDSLSKVIRQQIAIMYFRELREITKKVFFKSTLKKLSKAIRRIEIILEEQGFKECAKSIRNEWNKWLQKDLWSYLEKQQKLSKKQNNPEVNNEKVVKEIEVLKGYL